MPASSSIYKSIFGVSAKQNAAALRTGGAATGKGRPRRASASRGKSKERGSPLLEAQVITSKTRHLVGKSLLIYLIIVMMWCLASRRPCYLRSIACADDKLTCLLLCSPYIWKIGHSLPILTSNP